jgi:FkbM family methyltransferase
MEIAEVFMNYKIRPNGIIHIGAHMCQELSRYLNVAHVPIEKIVFIEGNPMVYERCKFMYHVDFGIKNLVLLNGVISDSENEIEFNIPTWEEAGSICKIKPKEESSLTKLCSYTTKTTTLPKILKDNNLDYKLYDFLVMDIQGAELLALKGMDEIIDNFEYIFTEVSIKSQYEDGVLIPELKSYLESHGFELVEIKTTNHNTFEYGDALFKRVKV